jgi:hypothetical protein
MSIKNIRNAEILRLLNGKSCHGDIIQPIDKVLSSLPDVEWFCPDPTEFAYCFWYSNDIIFAFGTGMHEIGIRLPDKQSKQENRPSNFIGSYNGDEWWTIKYDLSSIEKWAIMAYEYAKSS